jgi:hypothetical protein
MRQRAPAIIGLLLLAVAAAARADPLAYSARPIRGHVLDDVSGAPLEGVIVVAQWELVREVVPGLVNKAYGDVLKIVEVVTGSDGAYEIPAWGPLPRPVLLHLEDRDPAIAFFKPGYYPRYVANEQRAAYSREAVRMSQWDGQAVRLCPFTGKPQEFTLQDGRFRQQVKVNGTLEEYASKLETLQEQLYWKRATDDWRQFPRLVVALDREAARLAREGLKPGYQIEPAHSLHGGRAAVDRFLEGHEK